MQEDLTTESGFIMSHISLFEYHSSKNTPIYHAQSPDKSFTWQSQWERWEKSVCICLLNHTDLIVCERSHILGLTSRESKVLVCTVSVSDPVPLCLICLFEVSSNAQPSPFSPVPIIITIIMIIIIISAQLDAWLPEWESSLCVRSEQFASSLTKPVAQKKLRYRICQRRFSLVMYCLSYPMKWAACGQFGEITLHHLKFMKPSWRKRDVSDIHFDIFVPFIFSVYTSCMNN